MNENKNHEQGVLITGASSGIGLNLAREFARHGHPVSLVAHDPVELVAAAQQVRSEATALVETMVCDLRDGPDIAHLIAELKSRGRDIEILCNNAGVGFRGRFPDIPEEDHLSVVRLNVEAVVRLTRALLPMMLARGHGRILNTASIAGFEPGPMLATYHASKAFVLSLSESLATELADTAVTVTALCPGPVDTDFFPKAGMVESKAFQKMNLMAPQDVAAEAYKALMAGDRVVVPGAMNKVTVFNRRLTSESRQARKNEEMYEDAPLKDQKREPGQIAAEAEAKRART
jgi:short-subunit dehydrogenase